MAEYPPQTDYDTQPPHSLNRPPNYEDVLAADDSNEDIHLATVEEKKRRWWRNALINMLFIASWYVLLGLYQTLCTHSEVFITPYFDLRYQVHIRHDSIRIQQMDVRP